MGVRPPPPSEGRLVGSEGGAHGKACQVGAPEGAWENAPPRIGGHVEPPNGEGWGPPGGERLSHPTVGSKDYPKVGLLGEGSPPSGGVARLGGPKPGGAGGTRGPLQPPRRQRQVPRAGHVALGPRAKNANEAVKPGAPGPPQGANHPSKVAGGPVRAPRPIPKAV